MSKVNYLSLGHCQCAQTFNGKLREPCEVVPFILSSLPKGLPIQMADKMLDYMTSNEGFDHFLTTTYSDN